MKDKIESIVVFCASSPGVDPSFLDFAHQVGHHLASKNISIIYGGSRLGLMGALADGALDAGGEVIGVIPRFMRKREIEHAGLTKLHFVESMHQRKALMHELSDAVIALPGGFGTLEELFEMLTWGQLGLHQKPIGILNYNNYYSSLVQFLDNAVKEGLLNESNRLLLNVSPTIELLLDEFSNYKPPVPSNGMQIDET